jgi:hypothetical protein
MMRLLHSDGPDGVKHVEGARCTPAITLKVQKCAKRYFGDSQLALEAKIGLKSNESWKSRAHKQASFEVVCEIEEDSIEVYYGSGVSRRHSQLRRGLSRVPDGYSQQPK